MSIFRRPATFGEGSPLVACPGTIDMVWGGYWISAAEVQPLGSIYLDLTPTVTIRLDDTPNQDIYLDVTPYVEIRLDNTPSKHIYLDLTPSVEVKEM